MYIPNAVIPQTIRYAHVLFATANAELPFSQLFIVLVVSPESMFGRCH